VKWVADHGRLPVVNFAAGGVATPADAALMMQLGMDGVFVGSGIFKSSEPAKRAKAIVEAVTHFNNPKKLAEISMNLGQPMVGITDLVHDPVNFRDREAGEDKKYSFFFFFSASNSFSLLLSHSFLQGKGLTINSTDQVGTEIVSLLIMIRQLNYKDDDQFF
jgi:hypothetical protein